MERIEQLISGLSGRRRRTGDRRLVAAAAVLAVRQVIQTVAVDQIVQQV